MQYLAAALIFVQYVPRVQISYLLCNHNLLGILAHSGVVLWFVCPVGTELEEYVPLNTTGRHR